MEQSPPAGLTVGRLVHYVLPSGYGYPGEHRPAIVVKVWEPLSEPFPIQLVVFLDGSNDASGQGKLAPLATWATSVRYDPEGKEPGSWHWIERA
jgi:hypothetical protein